MGRRYKRARSRASGYARSAGRRARRGIGGLGVRLDAMTLAGVAIGFTNLDDKIPKHLTLAAAVAPVKGIGKIQTVAKGVLFGNLLQTITGRTGGGSMAGGFRGV